MNALKALVIGMGILIVAGVAVIAVTIVRRAGQDAPQAAAEPRPALGLARAGAALPSFGVRDIAVPPGSEVMSVTGADGRIILELRDEDGETRLLLLDPSTGAALGGWRLVESATARGMTPQSLDQ